MEPLFVYLSPSREVRVETVESALALANDPAWQHIASLDPRTYVQRLLGQHPTLLDDLVAGGDSS